MSFIKTLLTASLLAASTFVSAVPITGTIGFIGATVDNGTSLTFNNVQTSPFAVSNTGTYAGLNSIAVVMNSITYDPFYSVTNPLWSFTDSGNTYSFELATLVSNPTHLLMSGTGTLKATGFDDTAGFWQYTSQIGLTFSAGAAPVSEPATLALLGLGIAGLGFARRRQAKAA